MDKKTLLLSVAIIDLCFSYLLFTNQQYFSPVAMAVLLLLAFIAALIFIFAYAYRAEKLGICLLASSIVSLAIILYEITFLLLPQGLVYFSLHVLLVAGSAAVFSVFGIYVTRKLTKKIKGSSRLAALAILLGVVAVIAYLIMYGTTKTSWSGVDELAYNYYASSLFINGTNPYAVSMAPILNARHISPTVLLNGTYEYAYSYPAFSFMAFAFVPMLGVTSFFSFIIILVLLAVVAAYWSYSESGFRRLLLLPLGIWLLATYTLVGVTSQYLAVSILFFLAYMKRKRPYLSGALAGLAAATTQLAWFAIPFLYVLSLREHGKRHLSKMLFSSLLLFFVVNAYFFASYPRSLFNIFGLFGLGKLVVYGLNIMQFFTAFYPVPVWYAALVSITLLLAALLAFYRYTERLMPLLAVVPAMIFFVSWRNISVYALPFIPIIIAIYYANPSKKLRKRRSHKGREGIMTRRAYAALIVAVLLLAALGAYGHAAYSSEKLLRINRVMPIVEIGSQYGRFSLGGMVINVTNNNAANETVSFLIESRNPSNEGYVLGSMQKVLAPGETYNYTVSYQLPVIDNNTRIFIIAFSKDYYATNSLRLALAPPSIV